MLHVPSIDGRANGRLARLGRAFVAWAGRIGADAQDSPQRALQKRLVVSFSIGTLPLTLLWSVIYLAAGAPIAAAVPALYWIITPFTTLLFARRRHLGAYRFGQLLMTLVLPFALTLAMGGFRESSVVILWAALCPLAALLLEDLRRAIPWILGFVALVIASAILEPWLRPIGLPAAFVTSFFVLNVGAVISVAFVMLYYFVNQRNLFQERSEMLLLNILPKEISDELKARPRTIATQFDDASILFADVVNFTPMAAKMTPLGLVELLNEVFQCFDTLVERYGLEKIKTIGDCYMVAAGVPRPRPDHAKALVALALDMRDAVAARTFGEHRLAFRIGINSGAVVAGVIGRKKFIYDLWGEAVNLASRMESHGQAGAIQIARHTYERIKDDFLCEPKGTIAVKGADQMEIWHVLGRKAG